jgi:hypothetical protein
MELLLGGPSDDGFVITAIYSARVGACLSGDGPPALKAAPFCLVEKVQKGVSAASPASREFESWAGLGLRDLSEFAHRSSSSLFGFLSKRRTGRLRTAWRRIKVCQGTLR